MSMLEKPTKYTLSIEKGVIYFRMYGAFLLNGVTTLQAVRKITGKSLPDLRKNGTKLAKSQGVPFIDKTL